MADRQRRFRDGFIADAEAAASARRFDLFAHFEPAQCLYVQLFITFCSSLPTSPKFWSRINHAAPRPSGVSPAHDPWERRPRRDATSTTRDAHSNAPSRRGVAPTKPAAQRSNLGPARRSTVGAAPTPRYGLNHPPRSFQRPIATRRRSHKTRCAALELGSRASLGRGSGAPAAMQPQPLAPFIPPPIATRRRSHKTPLRSARSWDPRVTHPWERRPRRDAASTTRHAHSTAASRRGVAPTEPHRAPVPPGTPQRVSPPIPAPRTQR